MRQLRVHDIRWEADGVVSVSLVDPAGGPLPAWTPGAHIDLRLPNDIERQYSLCSDPADDRQWRVAVLHEPTGRGGSAYVHEQLRPGDLVAAGGPRNHFALEPADVYHFVAGGIGITPILPMIRAADAAGVPWKLLYGGRRRASMAFLHDLGAFGDRVTVVPEDEHGHPDLEAVVADWRPGTRIYCCGPLPLLAAIETRCAAADLDAALHVERFAPLVDAEHARDGAGFEVQLERSGITIHVSDGQTIVEAIEAAGIATECSCLEGVCGTCETTVLAGVPDHRDSILTEAERAAGDTMMICVSRAQSPSLRLDL